MSRNSYNINNKSHKTKKLYTCKLRENVTGFPTPFSPHQKESPSPLQKESPSLPPLALTWGGTE